MGLGLYASFRILELFGMEIPSKASLALIFGVLDIVPYIGNIV
jgi:predicted PurR-regulated permease PerM